MESDNCPFCQNLNDSIENSNSATSIFDKFPVTEYHSLIVPKRHVTSFFELTHQEYQDCIFLLQKTKEKLLNLDQEISGFNIGINDGHDAGQTIAHCHIHLIPRRKNDVRFPMGGIRHVLPEKGYYEKYLELIQK